MWYGIIILFLNIVLLYIGSNNGLSNCSWKVKDDLPSNKTPVYVRPGPNYKIIVPRIGYIELNRNDLFTVSCPGNNNYVLNQEGATSLNVTCDTGKFVRIINNDQRIKLQYLECNTNPKADVRRSSDNKHLEIGFNIEGIFLKIIRMSYDFYHNSPLYSEHKINGYSFGGYNERFDVSQEFKTNGVNSLNWGQIYNQERVYDEVLVPLLSKQKADEIRKKSYLAKGHLTPAADFVLPPSKRATYFFANVVPQWQHLNNGCWKAVELKIRNYAKDYNGDLKVYTGVYGVLRLEGVNNVVMPIYLNGNTVPVPKYIWKVVCSQSNMCIGFVLFNHPFVKTNSIEQVCKDICKETRWYKASFENNGKVVCCDVKVLKAQFNILTNLNVSNILNSI